MIAARGGEFKARVGGQPLVAQLAEAPGLGKFLHCEYRFESRLDRLKMLFRGLHFPASRLDSTQETFQCV